MPRILDTLDAAAGRTPSELDLGIDYLEQVDSPERLISAEGTYNAGWFKSWQGEVNWEASSAFQMAFHRFFHLTLDTGRHFIVWNIADFHRAGNTAILVVDQSTGRFEQESITGLFGRNQVHVSSDQRLFRDAQNHSFIRVDPDDRQITFSVHAGGLHLVGVAEQALGPPLVQCTRFHRGRGSLQWYGNLRLLHGTLSIDGEVFPLPPGCLGTYDRTAGHQRGLQNWNWIASVGRARCREDGRECDLGLQVHQDRAGARPRVLSKKHAVWVDGRLHKVPTATFAYDLLDEQSRKTGPWRITSEEGQAEWLDLTLTPRFQRREHRARVLLNVDFNQYYGAISGRLRVGGRTLYFDDMFAVAEESLLEL